MDESQPAARLYFFTYPRTGSNLLTQLLALDCQPNVQRQSDGDVNGMRFFLPLLSLKAKSGQIGTHIQALTSDERQEQAQCIRECYKRLLQHIQTAEKNGKTVCFKDHAHYIIEPVAETRFFHGTDRVVGEFPWTLRGPNEIDQTSIGRSCLNETLFPDSFLETWNPVFLIRHPAAAFPSFYRALCKTTSPEFCESDKGQKLYQKALALRWVRNLYDFYVQHFSKTQDNRGLWPVVIEADDIITQPAILVKLCEITGLDSSKLRFSWGKQCFDEPAEWKGFRETLYESTGIDSSKTVGDIDLEKESAKWEEEFGEVIARRIEISVREAIPDYLFLKSKKLQL